MLTRKQPIFTLLICALAALFASCGGAKTPQTATGRPAKAAMAEIELPGSITALTRNQYLPIVFELAEGHPQRVSLRDLLVQSYAAEFEALEPTDTLGRAKLFGDALAVHHFSDFAPERVSAAAVPMARWVAQHLARQGQEPAVLASLRFLMLAEPGKVEHKEKYFELSEWSVAARATMTTPVERDSSLIELYREVLLLVPDREIAEKLAGLYVTRHKELTILFRGRDRQNLDLSNLPEEEVLAQVLETPIYIIHAMFVVGDPAFARRFIEPLVGDTVDPRFLDLLDRLYQGVDLAATNMELARHLEKVDRRAALRAAFAARREDPRNATYPLYIGQTFDMLELPECAIDFYAEASRLSPKDEELQFSALELLRRAMLAVHFAEKSARASYAIEVGDAMIAANAELLKKAQESSPLPLVVAHLLYGMGDVEFDDGRIDAALVHYQRSYEVVPDSRALVRLSEVRQLRGESEKALTLLDDATASLRQSKSVPAYFEATIEERRADILSTLKRGAEAQGSWRRALEIWKRVDRSSEHAAMAAVRCGVLLDRLQDTTASAEEFRRAIRLDPDNRSTYAEILSFLVVRRRLEDAKQFYRLAYNQDRIEPMWKIYYSLWVEGLARRSAKEGGFDLARAYLEQSDGKTWQDNLAAFFVGKLTLEQLRDKAANRGQRVEVDYYSALVDLATGKATEAAAKLRQVLDSDLMGFFEYRMARGILLEELGGVR